MQLLLGSGCGHSSSQRVAKDGGVLVNASAVNITIVTADTTLCILLVGSESVSYQRLLYVFGS